MFSATMHGPMGPNGMLTRMLGRSPAPLADRLEAVRDDNAVAASLLPGADRAASFADVATGTRLLRSSMDELGRMDLAGKQFGYGGNGVAGWGIDNGADNLTALNRDEGPVQDLETLVATPCLRAEDTITAARLFDSGVFVDDISTLYEDVDGLARVARAAADGRTPGVADGPHYDGLAFSRAIRDLRDA